MEDRPDGDRYSPRAFLPNEVESATQREMFRIASRTASWCNTQPWQVHAVSGDALSQLAESLTDQAETTDPAPDFTLPRSYNGVYSERRREAGFALYRALGISRDDREARHDQLMKNYSFFGAPHTAIVTTDRDLGVFGAIDCGAFIANLLRAAHRLGVQTIPQAAIALYPRTVREVLAIPGDRLVVCAVSYGYADLSAPENAVRTERAAVDDFVNVVS